MKKKALVKLRLKRETLKALVSNDLRRANGGTENTQWWCPPAETDWCCAGTGSCCYTNQYSDCIDYTIYVCW